MTSSEHHRVSRPMVIGSAVVALSLIGLSGGAVVALLTGGSSTLATREPAITPSSSQAGLLTPTEAAQSVGTPTSTAKTETSTARVSSKALPTSEIERPGDADLPERRAVQAPAPAPVPAPAPAPAPRVQAPSPAPFRPAPAPAPYRPAPAPAPPPPPAPGITIDLGGRGNIVPQAPIAPKELRIG